MTFVSRRLRDGKDPHVFAPDPAHASTLSSALPTTVRAARGWWGWYGRWKARRAEEKRLQKSTTILRKICFALFCVLCASVVVAGTVKALVAMQILTPQRVLGLVGTDLPADDSGFTNFLLLGTGDPDHDGGNLTDTIMIASIDPKTKSVVLLTVPRDIYVTKSDKMGTGRVNSLYRDYKGYLMRQGIKDEEAVQESLRELLAELGRKLGIDLHYAVKVNFSGFIQAVDALGGVTIDVPEDLTDTQYPGPNYSYETFSVKAGLQQMDGETALKYARSRHSTSDFSRSARQQQILQALAEKARTDGVVTSPGKLSALWKILSENVVTTMNFGEMLGAGKLADRIERTNILSFNIHDYPGEPGGLLYAPPREDYGGAAVLLPTIDGKEVPGSWRSLRTFTYLLLHSRTTLLAHPQITILNAGAASGLARALADELTRFGFTVTKTANYGETASDEASKQETSVVLPQLDTDRTSAEYLATLLHMRSAPAPDPETTTVPLAKFGQVTIILGKDYTFQLMQDLVPSEEKPLSSISSKSSKSSKSSTPLRP